MAIPQEANTSGASFALPSLMLRMPTRALAPSAQEAGASFAWCAQGEVQDKSCFVPPCARVDDASQSLLVFTHMSVMISPQNETRYLTLQRARRRHGFRQVPTPRHRGLASSSRVADHKYRMAFWDALVPP